MHLSSPPSARRRTWGRRSPLPAVLAALCAALVAAALAAVPAAAQQAVPDGDPATTDRIDTSDPVAGAIAISRARFADGEAARAVLATSAGFADSLAAAPLLGDAPLLLTPPAALPDAVRAEIRRAVGTGEVLVLGGADAVGTAVVEALADDGHSVRRLAGDDRIATAVAIAADVAARTGAGDAVAVARAFGEGSAGWADSVTASGWAAHTGTPVLLTPTGSLDPRVAGLLEQLGTTATTVLGGTAALTDHVAAQLPGAVRVAGPDRTTTAGEVASQLWGPAGGYLVINGYADDGWASGLPAAGLSADLRHPILMAGSATLPPATRARVGTGCGTGDPQIETTLVGGPAALAPSLEAAIAEQDGGECPQPVEIRGDGLGVVSLGTPGDEAVAALTDVLGQPTEVSDERFPFCDTSASGRGRIYTWDNLDVYITDPTARPDQPGSPGDPGTGEPYLWGGLYGGFAYDPAADRLTPRPDPHGFTTDRGIGLGATNAEVEAAYGADASFRPGEPEGFPPPSWQLPGQLYAYSSANSADGVLQSFLFGRGCGE